MKKNFGIFNLLLIFLVFVYFDYVSKLWAVENLFIKYKSIQITSFLSNAYNRPLCLPLETIDEAIKLQDSKCL